MCDNCIDFLGALLDCTENHEAEDLLVNHGEEQLEKAKEEWKKIHLLLHDCKQLIEDMMPGVQHIALRDYALLNDTLMALGTLPPREFYEQD